MLPRTSRPGLFYLFSSIGCKLPARLPQGASPALLGQAIPGTGGNPGIDVPAVLVVVLLVPRTVHANALRAVHGDGLPFEIHAQGLALGFYGHFHGLPPLQCHLMALIYALIIVYYYGTVKEEFSCFLID